MLARYQKSPQRSQRWGFFFCPWGYFLRLFSHYSNSTVRIPTNNGRKNAVRISSTTISPTFNNIQELVYHSKRMQTLSNALKYIYSTCQSGVMFQTLRGLMGDIFQNATTIPFDNWRKRCYTCLIVMNDSLPSDSKKPPTLQRWGFLFFCPERLYLLRLFSQYSNKDVRTLTSNGKRKSVMNNSFSKQLTSLQ